MLSDLLEKYLNDLNAHVFLESLLFRHAELLTEQNIF